MIFQVETDKIEPKPRMTQRDKWANRPKVMRWLVWKDLLGWSYIQQGGKMFDVPVSVAYIFWITEGRRVDLDNLIKGCNDAMTGVAWRDDEVKWVRHYKSAEVLFVRKGKSERVRIEIEPYESKEGG